MKRGMRMLGTALQRRDPCIDAIRGWNWRTLAKLRFIAIHVVSWFRFRRFLPSVIRRSKVSLELAKCHRSFERESSVFTRLVVVELGPELETMRVILSCCSFMVIPVEKFGGMHVSTPFVAISADVSILCR